MSNDQTVSLSDLKAQLADIQKKIEKKESEEKAQIIKDIRAKMTEYGIVISDLEAKAKKPKGEYIAKYRKDDNEWSGKGKRPRWFKEAVANGDDMNQYLVNRSGR